MSHKNDLFYFVLIQSQIVKELHQSFIKLDNKEAFYELLERYHFISDILNIKYKFLKPVSTFISITLLNRY
jgi:hypothetical protein